MEPKASCVLQQGFDHWATSWALVLLGGTLECSGIYRGWAHICLCVRGVCAHECASQRKVSASFLGHFSFLWKTGAHKGGWSGQPASLSTSQNYSLKLLPPNLGIKLLPALTLARQVLHWLSRLPSSPLALWDPALLCSPCYPGTCCIAQAILELMILLSLPCNLWDYKHEVMPFYFWSSMVINVFLL